MSHELKLIEKYFENIIANLVFSALIMFGFFIKARVLTAETLGTSKLALLLFCEFLMIFVLVVFISYTQRTFPQRKVKSFCLILVWSLVLFAETCLAEKLYLSNYITNGVFIAIYAIVHGIICGIMILSVCNYLKTGSTPFLRFFFSNIIVFAKVVLCNLATVIVLSLVLFIPANGSVRTAENGPTPEQALAAEKKIFPFILLFFIPFFVLTFMQLYEDISEKC